MDKNMEQRKLNSDDLEQVSGGFNIGDFVKLKPTATLADGQIISREDKQRRFKIAARDDKSGSVSLFDPTDGEYDWIEVRLRDILKY